MKHKLLRNCILMALVCAAMALGLMVYLHAI